MFKTTYKHIKEKLKTLSKKENTYLFIFLLTMITSFFIIKLFFLETIEINNNINISKHNINKGVIMANYNSWETNTWINNNITNSWNTGSLSLSWIVDNNSWIENIEQKNKYLLNIKKSILNKYLKKDQEKLNNMDFYEDSKITKFVNNIIHFNKSEYEPDDLEDIKGDFLVDSKWWATLRKEANIALINMSIDFNKSLWQKITIVSAYRSYEYQKWIKAWWCSDIFCAKPWYSEHQTWLAVDLWDASNNDIWKNSKKLTRYYKWLDSNAHKYWFTNTYQKWIEIDWYDIEPWHWRYIWVDIATYLKENNLTLAELYNRLVEK